MPATQPASYTQEPPDTPQTPISTGSLRLDLALRTGGILPGEVVEISGPADSGKTTLCLHLAAAAGRLGSACAWFDADSLLDPTYALRCGVDRQQMLVVGARDAAATADILTRLAASEALPLIIIDSLSGLHDPHEPQHSDYLISLALRRMMPQLHRGRVSLVFTRGAHLAGPAYHALSSNLSRLAQSMYAGVRICLGQPVPIHQNDRVAGQRVTAHVQRVAAASSGGRRSLSIRRKISPFSGSAELDIMYNQGIIKAGEVFDLGLQLGLIHYRQGVFIVDDRDLGPDRATATAALVRLELAGPLEQVIRHKLLRNERLYH